MKYLRKVWVRIIVSLIGGGMMMELLHISTGDPNRPMVSNFSLLFGIIIFALISFYIRLVDWRR
ncbi:MAG: hypothetical protein ABJA37_15690 [Ferruginibacter sp.]